MTAHATAAPSPSRLRTAALFAAKVALAAALLGWLVRRGSLDFGALAVLLHPAWLLGVNLLVFTSSITLAALRWRALLGLCGARLPFGRAWAWQLLGAFFNTVIPGNVGGDVLKALYVARGEDAGKRPAILLVVVLERALGLAGLLALGGLVALLRWRMLEARGLSSLAWTVTLMAAGSVGGLAALTLVARRFGERLVERLAGPSRLAQLLTKVTRALVLLSARPAVLAQGLALSMALHGVAMGYFTLLAGRVCSPAPSYGDVATVFPLGLLTLVLPISPGGFGVGHVAFDRLFALLGLGGGATVFNVFLISQLVPGVSGVVPYLASRRAAPPTDQRIP